ncbi:hypothetical protein AA0113_g2154 [Alternaria arborescens]|uniref:Uncharacterized protein n=1 Tax=Alternaria arborescens TaxID=156630 RepID=A0A4Q4SL92_9PLEO|nr:hypothetical protein AA0112_g5859 [Alternaria arborescens]RYO71341.1 hypothetical protein AA0113_g2154 [Alternaria arborescens]
MWKRLQGAVRDKDKERHARIGNPVLLETTYDEDQLNRNPKVTDLQNGSHQNYALPPLSHLSAPHEPPHYRSSEVPTASSIYSQDTLCYNNDNPTATSPSAYDDISPPSSPEPEQHSSSFLPRRFRSMRDVSPMDEDRKKLEDNTRAGSHIPVLRRAPSVLRNGDAEPGTKQKFWEGKLAPNSKVKWDEYSGEPNSAGKAASVDPVSYAKGVASSDKPMGYQVSVSGPQKKNTSFGERVGRFGSKRSPPPVEPWSRATGRSEIAPPLKYQPADKPLQIPRKTVSPSTDQEVSNALAAAIIFDTKLPDTQYVTTEMAPKDPRDNDMRYNDSIKPIAPLKVGKNTPTSPQGLGITTSYPSPITPTTRTQMNQSPATVTPVEQTLYPSLRNTTPPSDKDKQAPISRFSWTTYNSATTAQHSPPPSPPIAKRVVTEPISAASSILNRRRPVPSVDSANAPSMPKVYARNPTSPYASSTFSNSSKKALPHPPSALSAIDHIAYLESQQEDLRIRRNNVYRLLKDLNNAAPTNPLVTDFKKARVAEERKKAFQEELDEIRAEEHDIGLKLHRAWKKRERDDPNSNGSALWVRRVTS